MVEWREINYRRFGLQAAFWSVMFVLLLMILSNFVNLSNTNQLSAYDDDWNDMSAFRQDIKDMGIETILMIIGPITGIAATRIPIPAKISVNTPMINATRTISFLSIP